MNVYMYCFLYLPIKVQIDRYVCIHTYLNKHVYMGNVFMYGYIQGIRIYFESAYISMHNYVVS